MRCSRSDNSDKTREVICDGGEKQQELKKERKGQKRLCHDGTIRQTRASKNSLQAELYKN